MKGRILLPQSGQPSALLPESLAGVTGATERSTGDRRRFLCLMVFLIASCAWLIAYFAEFQAFWSPDCGVRFAMIRSWVGQGQITRLPYPAAALDPTGQIHPLSYFLLHRAHDFCAMYPPLFPLLCGAFYRVLGFGGLVAVPLLCGLVTLWVTDRTARQLALQSRFLLLLALGLATPLLLYSVSFWDHSAQMLIAALAGFWMLRAVQESSLRCAAFAGTMLGFGMWVHELFLALFAAMWLAALPFFKGRRFVPAGLLLGFVPTLLAWTGFNVALYGSFGGPHLGANVFQNSADHPFSLGRILDGTQLAERAMQQLVGTAIFDSRDDIFPYFLTFVCLLMIYAFVGWMGGKPSVILPALGLTAGGLGAWLLLQSRGATSGLFLATPLLIPALAVPPGVRHAAAPASIDAVFYAWLGRTCWLFILFMLLNPMLPGVDWGSRYLLAALPLLALLAASALAEQYGQTPKRWRTAVGMTMAGMAGLSLVCQISGLLWVRRCLVYGENLNAHIRLISAPVLVTDTDMNARLVEDAPPYQFRFCVRSERDSSLLAAILRQRQPPEVAFVGSDFAEANVETALTQAGLSYVKQDDRPLWKVNHEREEGGELRFVHYTVKDVAAVKGLAQDGKRKL